MSGSGIGHLLGRGDLARRIVGVRRLVSHRDDDVLDHPQRLDAAALGGGGQVGQHLRERERPGVGVHESEFHAPVRTTIGGGVASASDGGCYGLGHGSRRAGPVGLRLPAGGEGSRHQQLRPGHRGGGLVVDTFWDLPHTREMIAQYARVWKGPARRVVNTHHNGDHCWGNQLFPDAEIIGHRLCAEQFRRESPQMMQALRGATTAPTPPWPHMAAPARRLGLHRHRAEAADDAGRRPARARPRRRSRSSCSRSDRRTPPAT